MGGDCLKEKGVPTDRLRVVRNWVGLSKIKLIAQYFEYRAELGVSNSTFVILYSGNIGLGRALDLVFDAACDLEVSGKELIFVIADEGPEKAASRTPVPTLLKCDLYHFSLKQSFANYLGLQMRMCFLRKQELLVRCGISS